MAMIPTPGSVIRHVRKTITFDGSPGAGQLGTAGLLFGITGTVTLEKLHGYGAGLECTQPEGVGVIIAITGNDPWDEEFFISELIGQRDFVSQSPGLAKPPNGQGLGGIGQDVSRHSSPANTPVAIANDLYLWVTDDAGGANITAGTITIDVWYTPITDDGHLAGDDEDIPLNAWNLLTRVEFDDPGTTMTVYDADGNPVGTMDITRSNLHAIKSVTPPT